jgi:RNA polymerase sigma-70 factor, ECF subfamily
VGAVQTVDRGGVRDPAAFLAATTTRLAINVLQSARWRREHSFDSWVPEPVDTAADPRPDVERSDALAVALRVLQERLTAKERAAFILREGFDYSYRAIAAVLALEEANARQVVTRARQHLANGRRLPADAPDRRRLLDALLRAARSGDIASLENVLAPDVAA